MSYKMTLKRHRVLEVLQQEGGEIRDPDGLADDLRGRVAVLEQAVRYLMAKAS